MTVLVTGGTGFLGGYLLQNLRGVDTLGLVRGSDPQGRLDAAVGGVKAVRGDLAGGPLSIPDDVTTIVHCAASVSFTMPLDQARAINVEGTKRLLDAAASLPSLKRFVHVSTAYVGGTCPGTFGEGDLDVQQGFRNTYERTKHEAEHVVRASGLPVTVVRPSIVVGESTTGWTSSFNVLYPPLQLLARGLVRRVPADPEAIVDVVPVDHVTDVIYAAMAWRDGPDTLHAVAGEGALRARELAALAAGELGQPVPELDPTGADLPPGGLEVYAPYFTVRTRFGADNARALGLTPPPLEDYLGRLLGFAREARWGKRAVVRAA
jgi:nucleoside-diphosphate-sugar epimerase